MCAQEGITKQEEVFSYLSNTSVPRSLSHHAMIVYHLLTKTGVHHPNSRAVAGACLLYALKERHRTQEVGLFSFLRDDDVECDIVALELLIVQSVRQKVLLVEGCLRYEMKQLLDVCPELNSNREDIIRLALILINTIYRSSYCLLPESSARGALVAACKLVDVTIASPPLAFQKPIVNDIVKYLLNATTAG